MKPSSKTTWSIAILQGIGLAAAPTYDTAREAYHKFLHPTQTIQQTLNHTPTGIEKLLTQEAYAEEKAEAATQYERGTLEFYDAVAQKAYSTNESQHYVQTVTLLKPFESDPNNQNYLFFNELGYAYKKLEKWEEAEVVLKKAVEINPNKWHAHDNLGFVYVKTGRYEEALDEYNIAKKLNRGVEYQSKVDSWILKIKQLTK